jgi:hypothetical protein
MLCTVPGTGEPRKHQTDKVHLLEQDNEQTDKSKKNYNEFTRSRI